MIDVDFNAEIPIAHDDWYTVLSVMEETHFTVSLTFLEREFKSLTSFLMSLHSVDGLVIVYKDGAYYNKEGNNRQLTLNINAFESNLVKYIVLNVLSRVDEHVIKKNAYYTVMNNLEVIEVANNAEFVESTNETTLVFSPQEAETNFNLVDSIYAYVDYVRQVFKSKVNELLSISSYISILEFRGLVNVEPTKQIDVYEYEYKIKEYIPKTTITAMLTDVQYQGTTTNMNVMDVDGADEFRGVLFEFRLLVPRDYFKKVMIDGNIGFELIDIPNVEGR